MTGLTGSLCYMAPEVFNAAPDRACGYDHSADIFSAAVCMRTLVTGQRPFEGERNAGLQNVDLACRVALEEFRMPLQPIKYAPMAKLISEMWKHDPAARPSAGSCAAQARPPT
ncbi:kinase-like domain-containing protein [Baffinella frigidus]|nr:kinase-like domain-containing protein [Cryptophyta sp. CCMP2293]